MPNVPPLRFPEFTGEWEKCRLQQIASISKGSGISKEQLSDDGEPCILYGELYTKYKSEVIDEVISKTNIDSTHLTRSLKNDVIIPSSGETAIDISTARCVPYDNILLGGDLSIIRLKEQDGRFFSYQLNGVRKHDIAKVAQGVSVVHLYGDSLSKLLVSYPTLKEQYKIADFLHKLDKRIATQIRVIEDLQTLKKAIIERSYNAGGKVHKIGELIEQVSERSKSDVYPVLSVNNRLGFIEQADQFEDRTVASDDTSNYKVVSTNDFAYNPARINVGSIARLKDRTNGIVSPMYVCFHTKDTLLPEYMEYFFDTTYFKHEMFKRLEGSVRLCLSYEGLCNISMYIPSIDEQKKLSDRLSAIEQKIQLESTLLEKFKSQKMYLLQQMFI